ncbi:MAG: hypothetical protein K9M80_08550 [Candidatus Marinimicrobia bacterium]|nr:hypothetical protein [Candidatus Neomarinimicrobiota bacterium]
MISNKKVLVLYSGGLDSRLAVKLLKENENRVEAIFFNLPFNSDKAAKDEFLEDQNVELHIINCYSEPWLTGFLNVLRNAEHGYGKGYNPCKDCKIFMKSVAQEFARKNGFDCLATGEVMGQRPMSQTRESEDLIDSKIDMEVVKPLEEIGIRGRSRDRQFELAKKYGIKNYPTPAGGCLLTDKQLKLKYKTLIENNLINGDTVYLLNVGRHFFLSENKEWYVVARDEQECGVIEKYENVIQSGKGKPAVFYTANNISDVVKKRALELQKAYQKHEDQSLYNKYQQWKI